MRVVPPGGPDGAIEALVAIGAELTTIAVRQSGSPRFIRSLAIGGSKLTSGIANAMHVDAAVAESLKRAGGSTAAPQLAQARKAIATDLRDIGEDVRATIDFFLSQSDGARIERLLVTGGASLTAGLVEELAGDMDADIRRIDPFAMLTIDDLGLDEQTFNRARATAATAVGLALWTADPPQSRLSVLPGDVAAARRARRVAVLASAGVAGLAGMLIVAGAAQELRVHLARSQVHAAQQQVTVLQSKVSQLQAQTAVHTQVSNRVHMVTSALQGDVDWVRVLNEVQAVTPASLQVQSVTATRSGIPGTSGASGVGSLNFTVSGSGGLPAVAAWLDGLQKDTSLQGSWVSGIAITATGGNVNFSSNTTLTGHAMSNRAQAVGK
jgi:hypothetical protein